MSALNSHNELDPVCYSLGEGVGLMVYTSQYTTPRGKGASLREVTGKTRNGERSWEVLEGNDGASAEINAEE